MTESEVLESLETASSPAPDGQPPDAAATQGSAARAERQRAQRPREWNAYRGSGRPKFANVSERECAELLDFYGVPWEYEPVTFVLETDEDGRVAEAFRPDFYLPDLDLFLEVTTMKQGHVTRKHRKVRKLRVRYPDVNVKLFYRRDVEALAQKLRSRGSWTDRALAAGGAQARGRALRGE